MNPFADARSVRRLAEWQFARDSTRFDLFPDLIVRKHLRMSGSPLGFLRGSAPLFYELIANIPELASGPEGQGWIVGDAHLENFGAFATSRGSNSEPPKRDGDGKREVVFHLNDFDEAVIGAFHWDVLRLTTSLILAARQFGIDGPNVLELSNRLLQSHSATLFSGAPVSLVATPAPVAELLDRVRGRSKKDLLDARTTGSGRERRLVRGERYRDLPPGIAEQVPVALSRYAASLPATERPKAEQLEVIDVAHRIAGTGSLGCLRIAVLTRGKVEGDGAWLFDMKEQFEASAVQLGSTGGGRPAERVFRACQACLECPPRMLGTTEIGGRSMLVRRLMPQEDKLELTRLRAPSLAPLSGYLGALLGAAHARSSQGPAPKAWTAADRRELLERAVLFAGIHEACYLEFCLKQKNF